jgi:hypothetical protein
MHKEGYIRLPRMAIEKLPDLSGAAAKVYMALTSHANRQGHAWPSNARLAQLTGLNKGNVSRAKGELIDAGLIEVSDPGGGRANVATYSIFGAQAHQFSEQSGGGGAKRKGAQAQQSAAQAQRNGAQAQQNYCASAAGNKDRNNTKNNTARFAGLAEPAKRRWLSEAIADLSPASQQAHADMTPEHPRAGELVHQYAERHQLTIEDPSHEHAET